MFTIKGITTERITEEQYNKEKNNVDLALLTANMMHNEINGVAYSEDEIAIDKAKNGYAIDDLIFNFPTKE